MRCRVVAALRNAVNIVDFRDRDSIMTPFPYTIDPLANGWTAPSTPTGALPFGTGLVWGCERPELLITETLAFHDRRTEDLNTDDNTDKTAPRDQMPGKITPSTPTSSTWTATMTTASTAGLVFCRTLQSLDNSNVIDKWNWVSGSNRSTGGILQRCQRQPNGCRAERPRS